MRPNFEQLQRYSHAPLYVLREIFYSCTSEGRRGMKLIYRDYSREYYREIGAALPDKIAGKFVQIQNNSARSILFFRPKRFPAIMPTSSGGSALNAGYPGVYNNAAQML